MLFANSLQTVVIVDAYSSGNLLASEFRRRGFDCVHVQSSPDIFPLLLNSYKAQDFSKNILHLDSLEQTLNSVRNLKPVAVLTGSETGVILADWLSENMGLKSNGTRLSHCRRNKYDMAEQIRSQGLRAVQQLKSSSFQETREWIRQHQLSWPLVIKPLHSAASDGVFLCESETELKQNFELQCGELNKLGFRNDELLVQEFLQGPEYVVDSVSCAGKHSVTDIWESHKLSIPLGSGYGFLYNFQKLISAEDPQTQGIQQYCFQVLDALEIKYGPAHAEIIMTSQGPVLIEVAARLAGTQIPVIVGHCTGRSPVELVTDAYCDPQSFLKKTERPYPIQQHGRLIYLRSKASGLLKSFRGLEQIQKLSSFHKIRTQISAGKMIAQTIDLNTVAGVLELVAKDEAALQADHEAFNEIQERGLFEISGHES